MATLRIADFSTVLSGVGAGGVAVGLIPELQTSKLIAIGV
jgi:hypothetical protein